MTSRDIDARHAPHDVQVISKTREKTALILSVVTFFSTALQTVAI
jgi:hypothetical protein